MDDLGDCPCFFSDGPWKKPAGLLGDTPFMETPPKNIWMGWVMLRGKPKKSQEWNGLKHVKTNGSTSAVWDFDS